ncbi:unnamed protein product [Ilex paraguariensis]|uniref:Uncharacterized protein n=1 Tax=Ilex paraguariensis TaxID=185542 RepID=A0ABC8RVN0_9AQUA
MATSIVTFSLTTPHIKPCQRSQTTLFFNPISHTAISKRKDRFPFSGNGSLRYLSTGQEEQTNSRSKMNSVVYCSPLPGAPFNFPFSWPPENSWIGWVFGAVVAIPLAGQWLLTLTKEVEVAAETVEKVAEAVEDVAEKVDKMAEDMIEKLPDGGLKNAVTFVENLAEETIKKADQVEELMDKVEEMDKKVESLITDKFNVAAKAAKDQE